MSPISFLVVFRVFVVRVLFRCFARFFSLLESTTIRMSFSHWLSMHYLGRLFDKVFIKKVAKIFLYLIFFLYIYI